MNDRELLEMAAKAAGVDIKPCTCGDEKWPFMLGEGMRPRFGHWNPLRDDGDAQRLAVDLLLQVASFESGCDVRDENGDDLWSEYTTPNRCHYEMARRAITRAAAEIGRAMP